MCGLAGLIRYDLDARMQTDRVLQMRQRLRHRGPEGEGLWSDTHAVLGHTRLALLDPDRGAQPMVCPAGRHVVVFNGEIHNHRELRRELTARWSFTTQCDTEVVLAAYATWGAACLSRFNGMFAFFIWDRLGRRGFAARDRLGVKPFVYAYRPGQELLFASEAQALLPALPSPPRAHLDAVVEYLVAPCFSGVERPMFEGLDYLPPGHALTISESGLAIRRWWTAATEAAAVDRHEAARQLRTALSSAVTRSLIADVPVGLFFSGGLDSTLIAALARGHGHSPPAFTVGFEDQASFDYGRSLIVVSDDQPFATTAATALALDREAVIPHRAALADDLPALAAHNDAIPAWEQEIAQHHLARAAGRRLKAVMVGDAADETHFGYHFLLDPAVTGSPGRILDRLVGEPCLRRGLLDNAREHFDARYRALAVAAGHDWATPAGALRATDWLIRNRWLQRLLHNGDIHCMAHGVEARVPFADTEVLDAAARVSPEMGLHQGIEKAVLREAARGWIPESIRLRRKSALPKDQGNGELLRREARRVLDEADDLIGGVLDVGTLRDRCHRETPLDERERALMFRVVSLANWARAHAVAMP